ncbi:MAG: helicase-related protein [Candidatus Caldarchaeum sp.]
MQESLKLVAQNILTHFAEAVHPQVVCIFTPFGQRVPLEDCRTSPLIKQFIERYERKAKSNGLFQYQADFLRAFSQHPERHFLLTTAAGLGKSLCFWAWVFDHLYQDANATALLCFPTQALMWSQVERLARLSEPESLTFPGEQKAIAYGGTIRLMDKEIGWTVWYGHGEGYTLDELMNEHENSDTFKSARIRIATVDKAHWSLIRHHKEFVRRLRYIVLDEVHTYSGIFGANVYFFLKRLLMSQELLRPSGSKEPRFFLASATLSNTDEFTQKLLPLDSNDKIEHIQDAVAQEVSLMALDELQHYLANPPIDRLLRFIVLVNVGWGQLKSLISSDEQLGSEVNAIVFSPSKFASRVMKLEMQHPDAKRDVVIYDADLPPPQRRAIERKLNDPSVKGVTMLATSAMELGVDIEGLDLCVLSDVPSTKVELLQRVGRIGRRPGKPGLAIVPIEQDPRSERILEDPIEAFQLDRGKIIPVPADLGMLQLRHMLAIFREWRYKCEASTKVDWDLIIYKLSTQFDLLRKLLAEAGIRPEMLILQSENRFKRDLRQQKLRDTLEGLLKKLFKQEYGDAVDIHDPDWMYKGFRGTDTYNIPLLLSEGTQDREIARVNQMDVFRDAHPEAVYLGHDSNFYRIVAYKAPSGKSMLPVRWLKSIEAIHVEHEERRVTTRGIWDDQYKKLDCRMVPLRNGVDILSGTWTYTRKWQGYREIDLESKQERFVSLAEVAKRFRQAVEEGDNFPFLNSLEYRTLGWRWDFGTLEPDNESFNFILRRLLGSFIADSVESNEKDIIIDLYLAQGQLFVLDRTPGGNGLSYALLEDKRFETALQRLMRKLSQFKSKARWKDFEKYISAMCYGVLPGYSVKAFLNAVQELYVRWVGESKE